MRISVTGRVSFSARHVVPGDKLCGRGDGHTWIVEVTLEGGLNPQAGSVVDSGAFLADLAAIAHELDHDDLNAMLGGTTTPEGVALAFRERLLLNWPGLTRVRVDIGYLAAEVEGTRR